MTKPNQHRGANRTSGRARADNRAVELLFRWDRARQARRRRPGKEPLGGPASLLLLALMGMHVATAQYHMLRYRYGVISGASRACRVLPSVGTKSTKAAY